MPNAAAATPRANHAAEFVADFGSRAPKTSVVIAALSAMATAPPAVQIEGASRLQAEIPSAHASALLHALAPSTSDDLHFGTVKPTGDTPAVLAFDRHLSVAMWLDAKGLPTQAPSHFVKALLLILGAAPDASTPSHATYIFAERQDPRAQQQTFQALREQLTSVDLHTADRVRPSPLAGCQLSDVAQYPTPEQPTLRRIAAALGDQTGHEAMPRVSGVPSPAVASVVNAAAPPGVVSS